jgi:hypothetical protein
MIQALKDYLKQSKSEEINQYYSKLFTLSALKKNCVSDVHHDLVVALKV